ncbi:MAG TPA: hypothetical protein H9867_01725 [Candidatus Corynebacterium gallistercoris]|uniref:Chloride channel protein n=1 Tax=Candidatus Corynebacterium gallistercoris TaxID=2838530 RepID=A0A9D1RVG5_9CORY|nr:hypothetical protein [Candidatus Corynebacterium gallistercoris]
MRPSPLGRLGVAAAAIAYGAASGAIAGLVFTAMHVAQHGVWHVADQRWMIFPIVVAAGALIAYIGRFIPQQTLAEQAHSAADLRDHHRGRGLLIAASAFVAVVAGGAIGPEAGIIAIVGEMSALVTLRMKEAKLKALLPAVGVGASMGAVWGSPAAGAAYDSDELTPGMALNVVAAAAGFLGFVGVLQLSATPSLRMTTEISMDFTPVMVVGVFLAGILGAAVAFVYRWADNVSTDAMKNLHRRVRHHRGGRATDGCERQADRRDPACGVPRPRRGVHPAVGGRWCWHGGG